MTTDQQRQALRAAFDALFVAPDRGPVDERVWICEAGEAPTRLPFPRHQLPPRAFTFLANQQAVARQHRRMLAARKYGWTDAQIEKRLRAMVADGEVFPTPAQFIQAGERRLYDHVVLRGGGPAWAAQLGIPYGQGNRKRCLLWTEDRVRQELAEFLDDRDAWPKMGEFRRGGKEGLRRAVARFGGMERWANEFEMPIGNSRGPNLTWTDEHIEEAVRELIGNRQEWPRRREFCDAGLAGAYAAIWRSGGVAHWAQRIGVSPPTARGGRKPAVASRALTNGR
jgi:hypothetical protein